MLHICDSIELLDQDKVVYTVKEIKNNEIISMHFNTKWVINEAPLFKQRYMVTEKINVKKRRNWFFALLHPKRNSEFTTSLTSKRNRLLEVGIPMFAQGYHSFETKEDAILCAKDYSTGNRNLVVFKSTIPREIETINGIEKVWISKDTKRFYYNCDIYCSPTLILQEIVTENE